MAAAAGLGWCGHEGINRMARMRAALEAAAADGRLFAVLRPRWIAVASISSPSLLRRWRKMAKVAVFGNNRYSPGNRSQRICLRQDGRHVHTQAIQNCRICQLEFVQEALVFGSALDLPLNAKGCDENCMLDRILMIMIDQLFARRKE
jgi:hypothetical protein